MHDKWRDSFLNQLFKLKNLEEPSISYSFNAYTNLVAQFEPLKSLKILRMSGTPLNTLDFAHLFPNLEVLNINDIDLQKIDLQLLKKFKNLKSLGISSVKMTETQFCQLASVISTMNLEELNLGCETSVYSVSGKMNVHGFDFSLLPANLKSLILDHTNVTDEDLSTILSLKGLKKLSFEAAPNMTGKGITRLASLPMLKELILGNNFRPQRDLDIDFSIFTHLDHLDLALSSFSPESWRSLCKLKSLKILNLDYWSLFFDEIEAALPECRLLTHLDIE